MNPSKAPMNRVHFSSKSDEWETPQAFFDELDREFHFVGDVCATRKNAKCEAFIEKRRDALSVDWNKFFRMGPLWMNCPYGRNITGMWVRKAVEMYGLERTIVCLLPARTDTSWWHDYVIGGGAEVRFVRGRLKFGGAKHGAPFPSAVVIFRAKKERAA